MAVHSKPRIIASVLVMLMFGSSVQAQSGDWQAVENLKRGTLISVKAHHRYLCSFESATQDELICRVKDHRLLRLPHTMTIARAEVREVRLEPSQAKAGWIGAGIGAGAGAAVGASAASASRRANAFFGALGGALVGGVVGTAVPIFRRGKVIYITSIPVFDQRRRMV